MSKQKTMTFETFIQGRGGPAGGLARRFVQSLSLQEPEVVPAEMLTHYRDAGASVRVTAKGLSKTVYIRTIDGVLWACLMPSNAGNSK